MRLPDLHRGERWLGLLLLATLPLANPYVRGEGHGHYAYLPSMVVDRDLHFENEYRRGDPDFVTSNFRRADGHLWPPLHTPTGRVRNQWPSGAALLWAPVFLQVHAALVTLRALGMDVTADGYGLAYRMGCAMATAVYAALGLLLALRAASRLTGPLPALLAAGGVWAASSLPVYMYFLPFYGHALAAFMASAFLGWWLARRPFVAWHQWAIWGAAAGLLVAVDPFALPLLLVALIEWAASALRRIRSGRTLLAAVRDGVAFAAAALAALLPDLAAKWLLHGSPLRSGRLTNFYWDGPRLWETAFSTQHGLFLWTPLVLAAVAGLAVLAVRCPAVGAPLLVAFAACFYMVASYELWHGSSSFGNRYFVALTPVFVLGLAALLERAQVALRDWPATRRRLLLAAPVAVLAAWNAGLMFQWGTGLLPRQGAVDPVLAARNQVTAVPQRIAGFALRYVRSREQATRERTTPD